MTVAANASLVVARIGNTVVPVTRSPRCRTCRSESRRDVEIALAEGRSYTEIAALFPESGLSKRHVSEHYRRGHLPLQSTQVRRVVSAQAAENGDVMQLSVDAQVAGLRFARSVVGRLAERLAAGEVEPTMKDGIAAAKLALHYDDVVIERDELRAEVRRTHDGMVGLLRMVRATVSDKDWRALSRVVDDDPDLRVFLTAPPG